MDNFFFNCIHLAPPAETLQDTFQSEVVIPVTCWMDSLVLAVSLSKLSLSWGSFFVRSHKIILAFVCYNREYEVLIEWNIANVPCILFMVLTIATDWMQTPLKSLGNGNFSTDLKGSVPGLSYQELVSGYWKKIQEIIFWEPILQ